MKTTLFSIFYSKMAAEGSGKKVTKEPGQTINTFEFINTTNLNQRIDEDDRFTVRSQVMKHSNQKKRHANDRDGTPIVGGGSTTDPVKQHVKRFRLLPQGLQDLKEQSRLRTSGRTIPNMNVQPSLSGSHHNTSVSAVSSDSFRGAEASNEISGGGNNEGSLMAGSNRRLRKEKGKALNKNQSRHSVLDLSAGQLNPLAVLPDGAPLRTRMLIHHYCK